MTLRRLACALPTVALLLGLAAASTLPEAPLKGVVSASAGALDRGAAREMPLYFIENRGQADPRARYYVEGVDRSVFFTSRGLALSLPDGASRRWGIRLVFVGATPTEPRGVRRTPPVVSYFNGRPERWRTGLPTYSGIVYRDLWPGIDLAFSGTGRELKYKFVLRPGADQHDIRLAYRGVNGLREGPGGRLQVRTPAGEIADHAPRSYQVMDGRRVAVPSSYAPAGETYGFDLGRYDHSKKLVIDPSMRVYAGYVGGSDDDYAADVAVDAAGAAYITGGTHSRDFPSTVGPDLTHSALRDAFVAKLAPDGRSLLYAGYIGGGGFDEGHAIAVDSAGAAYVTGVTGSADGSFPTSLGPDLSPNGGLDAFVAKLAPDGRSLAYSGFIGGSQLEQGNGIAVDSDGAAYLTGATDSDQASFPEAVGPDLTFNGTADGFVVKVHPLGAWLEYAGYIGGARADAAEDIAVDRGGAAYITGQTSSGEATFPVRVGPDFSRGRGSDAFVAKVAPDGRTLPYAGYIGGHGGRYGICEGGTGIALDSGERAFVTGVTDSPERTFPVRRGPDLTYNGGCDAFVAEVRRSGVGLRYAGYIGGGAEDRSGDIAVDVRGAAYVTGGTSSNQGTFPVRRGPDLSFNGRADAFVVKVHRRGRWLRYGGYIGGRQADLGTGIAVDPRRAAYVVGSTQSDEATFPVRIGPDLTYNRGHPSTRDGFVAKISAPSARGYRRAPGKFGGAP